MSITSESNVTIKAPADKVWQAMTDPALVKQWFFGTTVTSTWKEGEPIVFSGEWEGKSYEDKGIIQAIEPGRLLQYTHFSSRSEQADSPENYEVVSFELTEVADDTQLTIKEENLASTDARDKSLGLWKMALENLKKLLEQ